MGLPAEDSPDAPRVRPAFETGSAGRVEYLGEAVEPPLKIGFGRAVNYPVEAVGPNLVDVSGEVIEITVAEVRDEVSGNGQKRGGSR